MGRRVCGALVQSSCYQHGHSEYVKAPPYHVPLGKALNYHVLQKNTMFHTLSISLLPCTYPRYLLVGTLESYSSPSLAPDTPVYICVVGVWHFLYSNACNDLISM